jgi:type IV secretion system coupling TraD/TrwB family protein
MIRRVQFDRVVPRYYSAGRARGAARFASQLIGEREVARISESQTRSREGVLLAGDRSTTQSEHRVTESAVMASEIEALPDRAGYLKLASEPVWMKVEFPIYDLPTSAKPFVAE